MKRIIFVSLVGLMMGTLLFMSVSEAEPQKDKDAGKMIGEAKQEEEKEVKMKSKEIKITGDISMITPSYISVVYKRDTKKGVEYEMMLPLDKGVKFVRKDLEELKIGDVVSIKCDDHFEIDKEGKEICTQRAAKEVQFLSTGIDNKLVGTER